MYSTPNTKIKVKTLTCCSRLLLAFYEKDLRMQYPHEEVQLVRRIYATGKEAAEIIVEDYKWPVLTEKVSEFKFPVCDVAWLDTLDYGLDHVNLASTFFLSLPLKNEGPDLLSMDTEKWDILVPDL